MSAPTPDKTTHAWHFLATDGKTANADRAKVEVGLVLTVKPPITPCVRGLHGSIRLIDALQYAPGPILTRCAFSGEIKHERDKLAAERREVLWMADITEILWLASCHFAETAMRRANWTDERSWVAVETRRKWLRGEATDKEMAAACAAAGDAARDDAGDAARDAASAAAWVAAWAAARDEQNDWLECAAREIAGVDRLRALGNAVVPQVAEAIGRAILSAAACATLGEK